MALSSTIAAVRSSIVALVGGVAGIGNVHGYIPHPKDELTLKTLVEKSGVASFALVTLAAQNPLSFRRRPANQEFVTMRWQILMYLRTEEGTAAETSEQAFFDLVEDVIDAFRADKKLGNTVIEGGPAQWEQSGHADYHGVLCHFARLSYAIETQVEPTPA